MKCAKVGVASHVVSVIIMTSDTSVGRVLAYFCLVALLQRLVKL